MFRGGRTPTSTKKDVPKPVKKGSSVPIADKVEAKAMEVAFNINNVKHTLAG